MIKKITILAIVLIQITTVNTAIAKSKDKPLLNIKAPYNAARCERIYRDIRLHALQRKYNNNSYFINKLMHFYDIYSRECSILREFGY